MKASSNSSNNKTSQYLYFIDLVKGVGIIEFVCYHVFVNFYANPVYTAAAFRILFTVTGFFVFSSGFLVGHLYYDRNRPACEKHNFKILKRLFLRAAKLLLIVYIANLLMLMLESKEFSLQTFFVTFSKISSMIYIDRWDISLQVLVAISFTLCIGYLMVVLIRKLNFAQYIFLLLLCLTIVADFYSENRMPYLWRYLLHGLLGVIVGIYSPLFFLKQNYPNKQIKIICFGSSALFITILVIVTSVPESFNFFLYDLGLGLLSVGSFFFAFSGLFYIVFDVKKRKLGWSMSSLQTLGKHSLVIYLFQIILIDSIVLLFGRSFLDSQMDCIAFSIVILVACIVCCQLIVYFRRNDLFNKLYMTLF